MLVDWLERLANRFGSLRIIQNRAGTAPYLSRTYLYGKPKHPDGGNPFDASGEPRPNVVWPKFGLLFHRFHQSDSEQELHSHPFKWAISIILDGAYREELRAGRKVVRRIRGPGSIALLRRDTYHRVDLLTPSVRTLFITGPRLKTWRFWCRHTGKTWLWWHFIQMKRVS